MRGTDLKLFQIEHQELTESKKEFVPETGLATWSFRNWFSRFIVSNQPSKLVFMKNIWNLTILTNFIASKIISFEIKIGITKRITCKVV